LEKLKVENWLGKHRGLNFSENSSFRLKNDFKNRLTNKTPIGIDSVEGCASKWYRSYHFKSGEKTRKNFSRIYGHELTPEEGRKIRNNLCELGRILLEINRGSDEVRDIHED
jgi:hypothetical protein